MKLYSQVYVLVGVLEPFVMPIMWILIWKMLLTLCENGVSVPEV